MEALLAVVFPPIGHLGICYSNGLITDFLGPRVGPSVIHVLTDAMRAWWTCTK